MRSARRPIGRMAAELKPMSQATSTSAVCNPMDASTENQTDRYKRIPSNVVYQETMESRQLATNSPWTRGRLMAAEFEEANAMRSTPYLKLREARGGGSWYLLLFFLFAGLGGPGGSDDFVGLQLRHVIVMIELHLIGGAALRHRNEIVLIGEHFRHGDLSAN